MERLLTVVAATVFAAALPAVYRLTGAGSAPDAQSDAAGRTYLGYSAAASDRQRLLEERFREGVSTERHIPPCRDGRAARGRHAGRKRGG